MYARSVKFTTSSPNEELLQNEAVIVALKDMLSARDDEQFNLLLANGIDTNVDLFIKDSRVQINNGFMNDLIENQVYSTNNITRIRSIKLENPTTGVVVFTMADR